MSYPEFDDPDFYQKIYSKKEFNRTKAPPAPVPELLEEYRKHACNPEQFNLQSYQEFVRNYISSTTNYNGLLLFWGVGTGKCVLPGTQVYLNGQLTPIETLWIPDLNHQPIDDDCDDLSSIARGQWLNPSRHLIINSYDQDTKSIIEAPINRLYRQMIHEPIRIIQLSDGHQLRLTRQHHLLTERGWTNQFSCVKTIAIPRTLINSQHVVSIGESMARFLAWHLACGYEDQQCLSFSHLREDEYRYLITLFMQVNVDHKSVIYSTFWMKNYMNLKIRCPDYIESLQKGFIHKQNNSNPNPNDTTYTWAMSSSDRLFPALIMGATIEEIRIFLQVYCDLRMSINLEMTRLELPPISRGSFEQLSHLFGLVGVHLIGHVLGSYVSGFIEGHEIVLFDHHIGFSDQKKKDECEVLLVPLSSEQSVSDPNLIFVEIAEIREEIYEGYVYDLEIDKYHNYVADGVLCHNTCGVVQIVEGLKETVRKLDKKIYVITKKQLVPGFIKELYNGDKRKTEKFPGSKQCIGDTYYLPIEPGDTIETQDKKVKAKIKQYYEFYGPRAFTNFVDMKLKKRPGYENIGNYFSNSVFVIDEAHNLTELEAAERRQEKTTKEYGQSEEKDGEEDGEEEHTIEPEDTESDSETESEDEKKIKKSQKQRAQSDRKIVDVFREIFRDSEGIKLLLLTATPMKDTAEDLVMLLNLLHMNDKHPEIRKDILFPSENQVNEQYLKQLTKGYISYVRGENQATFPRVMAVDENYFKRDPYPKRIPPSSYMYLPHPPLDDKGAPFTMSETESYMKHIHLIRCPMSNYQFTNYLRIMGIGAHGKKGEMRDSVGLQASNMIFPSRNASVGNYGQIGFKEALGPPTTEEYIEIETTGKGSKGMRKQRKKKEQYITREQIPVDFLHLDRIAQYSSKIHMYLLNVIHSRGIVYTYSDFVDAGAKIIALALEANGYMRFVSSKMMTQGIGNYLYKTRDMDPGIRRCAICGQINRDHQIKVIDHEFKQGYYILFTGGVKFTQKEIDIINSRENKNGERIKIVLGTRVSGEGLDFKRIREVHIMDPWHNNTRLYQVIGRAARHCSHIDLAPKDQTVTVFRYCASAPEISIELSSQYNRIEVDGLDRLIRDHSYTYRQLFQETTDEKVYRRIEHKDLFVKRVERILKISAVDCRLNKTINVFPTDRPGTRECDYQNDCDYQCEGDFDERKVKINTDTYNMYFSEPLILRLIRLIIQLYQSNFAMTLDNLVYEIQHQSAKTSDVELNFIYEALDRLLGYPPHKAPILLYDRFNRPGHLIFSKPFYIFQPDELTDQKAPLFYKMTPLTLKKTRISLRPLTQLKRPSTGSIIPTGTPILETSIPSPGLTTPSQLVSVPSISAKMIETLLTKLVQFKTKYQIQYELDRISPDLQEILYEMVAYSNRSTELKKIIIQYFEEAGKLLTYTGSDQIKMYVGHYINGRDRQYLTNDPTFKGKWVNPIQQLNGQWSDSIEKEAFQLAHVRAEAKSKQTKEPSPSIWGFLSLHEKKGYIFKIVDHTGEHKKFKRIDLLDPHVVSEVSQRTTSRGRECTNYSSDQLKTIMETLEITSIGSRVDVCRQIELQLRMQDDDPKGIFRTFYRPWEIHPMIPQLKTEAASKSRQKRKSKT